MSDEYDYGYCDICDRYHDEGCPRLKRAKKDRREWFRLFFRRFGLDEDFANE